MDEKLNVEYRMSNFEPQKETGLRNSTFIIRNSAVQKLERNWS